MCCSKPLFKRAIKVAFIIEMPLYAVLLFKAFILPPKYDATIMVLYYTQMPGMMLMSIVDLLDLNHGLKILLGWSCMFVFQFSLITLLSYLLLERVTNRKINR